MAIASSLKLRREFASSFQALKSQNSTHQRLTFLLSTASPAFPPGPVAPAIACRRPRLPRPGWLPGCRPPGSYPCFFRKGAEGRWSPLPLGGRGSARKRRVPNDRACFPSVGMPFSAGARSQRTTKVVFYRVCVPVTRSPTTLARLTTGFTPRAPAPLAAWTRDEPGAGLFPSSSFGATLAVRLLVGTGCPGRGSVLLFGD